MNLKELRAMAQSIGSVVLVEDGQPSLVVLDWQRYQAWLGAPVPKLTVPVPTLHGALSQVPDGTDLNMQAISALGSSALGREEADPQLVERLNRDIALLKEEIKKREIQELSEELVNE